jgi:hypothetical protein
MGAFAEAIRLLRERAAAETSNDPAPLHSGSYQHPDRERDRLSEIVAPPYSAASRQFRYDVIAVTPTNVIEH